jgi:acyl dehydratase
MRIFNGVPELEAAIGEQLGVSDWHEITQEQVDLFAEATGDHQWIHVDPVRAAKGPFGGTIAQATSPSRCCRCSSPRSTASTVCRWA